MCANGHDVLGWEHNEPVVDEINDRHTNSRFLPDIDLHPRLVATSDVSSVFTKCDIVFVAIPSVFITPTLAAVRGGVPRDCPIVNMAKGTDRDTGLTSFQTIGGMYPDNRRVMLSGPSIANEFARAMPTVVVLAGDRTDDLLAVSNVLDNDGSAGNLPQRAQPQQTAG